MSEVFLPIAYQLGAGGVLGFVVGYAIKKMLKILAVILGLFALAIIYLGYSGIIQVNYEKFAELIERTYIGAGQASQWMTPIIAHLPFAGSFLAGIALGLKVG